MGCCDACTHTHAHTLWHTHTRTHMLAHAHTRTHAHGETLAWPGGRVSTPLASHSCHSVGGDIKAPVSQRLPRTPTAHGMRTAVPTLSAPPPNSFSRGSLWGEGQHVGTRDVCRLPPGWVRRCTSATSKPQAPPSTMRGQEPTSRCAHRTRSHCSMRQPWSHAPGHLQKATTIARWMLWWPSCHLPEHVSLRHTTRQS